MMDITQYAYRKLGVPRPRSDSSDSEMEEKLLYGDRDLNGAELASMYDVHLRRNRSSLRSQCFSCSCLMALLNVALFCITILTIKTTTRGVEKDDSNTCVRTGSAYSPVLESMPINYHMQQVNGTIWPPKDPSWNRKEIQDPGAEEMWTFFEDIHMFPISRTEVLALGKDPKTVAQLPDEMFGLGEGAYIGSLDIQHKLHCLNELRKMAFATYGEHPSTKKQHGQLWWLHLRHCLDIVTEDIMCHADADVVTYRWVDTEPYPFPDFSVNRKCRNFDDLIRWRDERSVDMDVYARMTKPSGVVQVPHEPGYYAAYGFYWSDLYPNGEGYPEDLPTEHYFGLPPTPDQGKETVSHTHPN